MKKLILLLLVLALPGLAEQPQTFFNPQVETTCDTNGELIVAANPRRRYLLLQNKSATIAVYLKTGSAPTPTAGVRIDPGGYWEMDAKVTPQSVYCATASSTAVVVSQEGN